MKKKRVFLLVLMVLSLAACGKTSSSPPHQKEASYKENTSFDYSADTWLSANAYNDEMLDSLYPLDSDTASECSESAYEDIYIEN